MPLFQEARVCRSLPVVLGMGVSLAVVPFLSMLGSPSAVRAMQPATPVTSPVAGELRIHDLQGAAHRTTREGQFVTDVPGIVTALRPEGFYLQDPVPDGNDATSGGAGDQEVSSALSDSGSADASVVGVRQTDRGLVWLGLTDNDRPLSVILNSGTRLNSHQVASN